MEACLFCDSDKESSALEPDKLFVCSRCTAMLRAQDDKKLQSAHAVATAKGKVRKALAIKHFCQTRGLNGF